MTDISKLGEFGLIDRLTKDIKPKNDSTIYGVGDDCAVQLSRHQSTDHNRHADGRRPF